jgi:hypothetical protein
MLLSPSFVMVRFVSLATATASLATRAASPEFLAISRTLALNSSALAATVATFRLTSQLAALRSWPEAKLGRMSLPLSFNRAN